MSIGSYCSIHSELSLAEEVLEVVEQTDSHGVLHVYTFHTGQVASSFSNTLTDSHDAVVKKCPGVSICCVRITETCGHEKGNL